MNKQRIRVVIPVSLFNLKSIFSRLPRLSDVNFYCLLCSGWGEVKTWIYAVTAEWQLVYCEDLYILTKSGKDCIHSYINSCVCVYYEIYVSAAAEDFIWKQCRDMCLSQNLSAETEKRVQPVKSLWSYCRLSTTGAAHTHLQDSKSIMISYKVIIYLPREALKF